MQPCRKIDTAGQLNYTGTEHTEKNKSSVSPCLCGIFRYAELRQASRKLVLLLDLIRIGVGTASGTVMAGFAGTRYRATYTCIGDPVNLSARIESHTKTAKCPM